MERGSKVIVIAYRGQRLQRRVWDVTGRGVLVCSESDYQRAIRTGEEPLWAGFPRRDVIEYDDDQTKAEAPA